MDENKNKEKVENIETNHEQVKTQEQPNKKSKLRMILVLIFIAIFSLAMYVVIKGSYLEYQELGEHYIEVFWTNFKYQYTIMGVNFVLLFAIMYFTNRGIKKGLSVFFEQEKKEMPKLPNKSISLVVSAIVSVIIALVLTPKLLLATSGASFGITDRIFNLDISYYMFIKPVVNIIIVYFTLIVLFLTVYTILYYVIVFNMHFDGIDRATLKSSNLMKKLTRNARMIAVGVCLFILIGTQNVLFEKYLELDNGVDIIGAGLTESIIKVWGYAIFAAVILITIWKAIKYFKQSEKKKLFISLACIPSYLVALFIVMFGFNMIFVKTNELDTEKDYISTSIENTRKAYNIDINETTVDYSGTITLKETQDNKEVVDNVVTVSKPAVLETLKDRKTETGYYVYRDATIGKYDVDGKARLVYLSPREIISNSRTYNNKTYEYTHGIGEIITSATSTTETGAIEYIQNDIDGDDNKIKISQPRIYFGLETNDTIATGATNKEEYDYTDENGKEYTYKYDGKAGLQLGFLDRLILGIRKGDLNLAFSGSINKDSKILINRNVIERAKKSLPDLIFDENPYTVIDKDGNIIWVVDAYTYSSDYPYSSYTTIERNNAKAKINYIRNSIKVLINSYDGTMKYYITDRTDPIAMAYMHIYPDIFEDIDSTIPEDISKHFIYPEYLYHIQSEMLTTFHNVKPDVLYRSDDIWDYATYNANQTTKSTGNKLSPYYTMVKTKNSNSTLGLVQMYTPEEKQNIISYLVGSYEGGNGVLKMYKFSTDSSVLGSMQLDKQIEQDETISSQLKALNVTGTKITKQMIIVPMDDTLLYVEPVYQTMLNESDIPMLKKVIVASGNKVAIGDTLSKALNNLLSQYAVDINVENTDDINGLIDAIIKANNNLTDSNKSNNWEQMGSDVKKLQELITSLQKLKEEQSKKAAENNTNTNSTTNTNSNGAANNTATSNNASVNNTTTNTTNNNGNYNFVE